ncbi:MAG: ABC transporter substrate-binding protein [Paralcaligenes sp.]
MKIFKLIKIASLTGALSLGLVLHTTVNAKTLHWAYQSDIQSLDPMALNETFTMGTQDWFYESLVTFDKDLKIIPRLAVSWENSEPTKWIFHLRHGVKFHDGTPFTADDVIFSWKRSLTPGSDLSSFGAYASAVRKIDDYTVEVTTPHPDPMLPREWIDLRMMSRAWSEKNHTTEATSVAHAGSNYANLHENGTGPFMVVERQPDVKTVMKRFDGYWNKNLPTNITDIVFQPISQESTRTAALISGEMDLILPVPIQDWPQLEKQPNIQVQHRPETRPLVFGMDQRRDELLFSNVKGKNPFKDKRVREAMNLAVDTNVINQKIMRGAGRPIGTLIADSINGYDESFGKPYKSDPKKAKELLTQAGYPNGFSVQMDCPNDRYINDEKICQAVASMLARVGIKIDLLAQSKSKFFAKVLIQGGAKTSLFLQGFSPSSVDAGRTLDSVVQCRDDKAKVGSSNLGGYCNPAVDALIVKIRSEFDEKKRNAMIKQAFTLVRDDYGYIPIVQQPLSWAVKKGVKAEQRADGVLNVRDIILP